MPQADRYWLPGAIKALDQIDTLVFVAEGEGSALLEPVSGPAMRQDNGRPQ